MMDQSTINIFIGAVFAAFGWFAKTLWDAVGGVRADLTNLRVSIATDYVSHDTLERIMSAMKEDLTYIRERVDAIPQHRRLGDKDE